MKILLNGNLYEEDELVFTAHNRGFRYGDSFFESIRLVDGKGVFLDNHYGRLVTAAQTLRMELHQDFTLEYFKEQVNRLAKENGITAGGRARLVIYRNDGGLYQPETNKALWFLEVLPYENNQFVLNEKGLKIDIYQELKKPINFLSKLKTGNSLLFVMASLEKEKLGFDDFILLNEKGFLCEMTSSNFFLVQGKTLLTPSLKSGCLEGMMRKLIMELAPKAGYEVIEADEIGEVELNYAEEVFITTAVVGIKWVAAYKQKRYFNKVSKELVGLVNDAVLSSKVSI